MIAREIFDGLKGEVPGFFKSSRWKGRVMDWAMKDEKFKVQLFRFVDAIPSLTSEKELLELFSEYFYSESPLLPKALKRFIPHRGVPAYIAGKLIKANVTSLAKQFIAGSTPKDALTEISRIRKEGRTFSIDLLGEVVLSDREAEAFEARYLELISTLGGFIGGLSFDALL
ncbi:MAG: L-glutamate gamma-semialdehyde dehydrogenase, partial [Thermodesulfobacteriota bacterium]